MSLDTAAGWDARYADGGFQFGEAPNRYLEELRCWMAPGMRALALGDGEGRNGAWLAQQGLLVTSLDWSPVGTAKAAQLAARRGVAMETVVADAAAWDFPENRFDLVAWIYLHLPPPTAPLPRAARCARSRPAACSRSNVFRPRSRAAVAAARKPPSFYGPAPSSRTCSPSWRSSNCWRAPSASTKARAIRGLRKWCGRY
jgi:SAM-dependent methyltransferase